jgi:hypothetical protein
MDTADIAFGCYSSDHIDCQRDTVVFDFLVIMLLKGLDQNRKASRNIMLPTRIGSNAADIAGGTLVPHNLINRRNDEYVCIGIMPGMMGTLMPEPPEHNICLITS